MIFLILKKELNSFFRNPLTYVLLGLFSLLVGWMFFSTLLGFIENTQNLPLNMRHEYDFTNQVITKLFGQVNFLLLFISPMICMKIFSEELRSGTINLYFTSPVKDYELVLAKYLSLCIQGIVFISTTFIFPIILSNIQISDISFLIYGYLGLILNFACYAAIGIFASSLGKQQVLAALLCFFMMLLTWMIGWASQMTSNFLLAEFTSYFSLVYHFETFVKGNFSTSDFVFYGSFIFVGVYLTVKRFESRTW